MNKKEFIKKFCLYYKGEEESPFEHDSPKDYFWFLERQYWSTDNFSKEEYQNRAKKYIKDHPDERNFMTSDSSIEQKGFVMFAEDMLEKWAPQDVHYVFEYGK